MATLLISPLDLPAWLRPMVHQLETTDKIAEYPHWVEELRKTTTVRRAAVLVLIGGNSPRGSAELPQDACVLLTRRAARMRAHAGQVAFPGGEVEESDAGPAETALREAWEETGVERGGIMPIMQLEPVFIPPSGFEVIPVVAFWSRQSPVSPANPQETDLVRCVPITELAHPPRRWIGTRGPFQGPAFELNDMFVWGFTAGVISQLLTAGGWEVAWDKDRIVNVETMTRTSRSAQERPSAAH